MDKHAACTNERGIPGVLLARIGGGLDSLAGCPRRASRVSRLVALVVIAITCLDGLHASIVIDGFTAATNDRFADNGAFILDAYSLSGVGLTSGGYWGTLISPNVFVSATHYHPANNSTIMFYDSNSPTGGSVSRTVMGSQQVGTSDVWLGFLDQPLPSGYVSYGFADPASFVTSGYAGATVYMVGRSQTNTTYGSYAPTDQAVGMNILDASGTVTVGSTTDYAIGAVQNLSGDANYLPYEAYLQIGDSGGPLFTITGGELELVGINWFIGTIDIGSSTFRESSGFSYVGNYATTLQTYIDAHPVPEPSSCLLLLGALTLLAGDRRRRRRGRICR